METLFTRCSLLSACFSFGLFLFCLPDMCAFAIFQENQNKCKRSIGLCHFIFLSICLSVRHAPYLRNRTSSNQNFLIVHTCKWNICRRFFFHFFEILIFWAVSVSGVKRQKIAQNGKWKLHMSHVIHAYLSNGIAYDHDLGTISLHYCTPPFVIGLFQKMSKQGELRIWNFQGYQKNSMWNGQGLIKNEVEFPMVTKKKYCGISRGLCFWP